MAKLVNFLIRLEVVILLIIHVKYSNAFQIYDDNIEQPYFLPYQKGFVGTYGDPSNYQRERINEGAFETPTEEIIFEGVFPRQICPGMVGPFTDGNYYCTAREYGYCDRRSGACFCNTGYQGFDCTECTPSYFKVGDICYPKKLCPDDCSFAGECDFWTGHCKCLPHRIGDNCGEKLCSSLDPLCVTCTNTTCLMCSGGYYINAAYGCSSCYDFDPRCAGCTLDEGCTLCADPLLNSVRRSGYRASDPKLPVEEATRELSVYLPFGTKSPEAFSESESFIIASTPQYPLKNYTIQCDQGLYMDARWTCSHVVSSHIVCGHMGVFRIEYSNYVVSEADKYIRISVLRSGGGVGNITIVYNIFHITTNDSDVTATAPYTSSQTLYFNEGVVQLSFLMTILDDTIVEDNEVFQIVLNTPEGGGSVGSQFRANVTIIDDDLNRTSAKLSHTLVSSSAMRAGHQYSIPFKAILANGKYQSLGGEIYYGILENYYQLWRNPGTASKSQRQSIRYVAVMSDHGNGSYSATGAVHEQGNYQLRLWHCVSGGLIGDYYSDAFFQNKALSRVDKAVNFTWGSGRLLPSASDYVSIRWRGLVMTSSWSGTYYFKVHADDECRLWVNGILLIDHWHEQRVNLEDPRGINLLGSRHYEVILEYRDIRGDAYIKLLWGQDSSSLSVIPMKNLYAMYQLGNSPANISITSSFTSANTTECSGEGLSNAQAGETATFNICPRDVYHNFRDDDDEFFLGSDLFHATMTLMNDLGHSGYGAEVLTPELSYHIESHCWVGLYVPYQAGNYQLEVWHVARESLMSTQVLGSPFNVTVTVADTSGPYSTILGLGNPVLIEAGKCTSFTIVARDVWHNWRFIGGDDFEVYMLYQQSSSTGSRDIDGSKLFTSSGDWKKKYGTISNQNNGTYVGEICPVLAGWYDVHVVHYGPGVIMYNTNLGLRNEKLGNQASSQSSSTGKGSSYRGLDIGDSPHRMFVSHTAPSPMTTSVVSPQTAVGLLSAVTGFPSSFIVTIRDSWGNIVNSKIYPFTIEAVFEEYPETVTHSYDLHNGSYRIQYIPEKTGINQVSVYLNGFHIMNSPFYVPVTAGNSSSTYSYAVGPGLHIAVVGTLSYFEVLAFDTGGNFKNNSNKDVYTFSINSTNSITSRNEAQEIFLLSCPDPPVSNHPACGTDQIGDSAGGHYFGSYLPVAAETILIRVYLGSGKERVELKKSNFTVIVYPGPVYVLNSIVTGTLYDVTAGERNSLYIQTRDSYGNNLISGGLLVEVALIGVSGNWGVTIQEDGQSSIPSIPNEYHYQGFYSSLPNYYGIVTDNNDGSYTVSYAANLTGEYILRISIAESGLNGTYFDTTTFGYLSDFNFNEESFIRSLEGANVNPGSSISWTGDIGGSPGLSGDLGKGSYLHRFKTRVDGNINFNLSKQSFVWRSTSSDNATLDLSEMNMETSSFFSRAEKYRDNYYSVRWTGMITPTVVERYNFSVSVDSFSSVTLRIGGRGLMTNNSEPGEIVLKCNQSDRASGYYQFSNLLPREFSLEYIYYLGDSSSLKLYWESPSTPFELIPASAFTRWVNVTHRNLTVHPAPLHSRSSTVVGVGLVSTVAGTNTSFYLYSRDAYGNLLQKGGDVPSLVGVSVSGTVGFRGFTTDYGNSTYKLSYYPKKSGMYRLYITVGCCPPHPNVGIGAELQLSRKLFVNNAPYFLNVTSGEAVAERSVAFGTGSLGGVAGDLISFDVFFRDLHSNPTIARVVRGFKSTLTVNPLSPTLMPLIIPTLEPSVAPSNVPTSLPSSKLPTVFPSFWPSSEPTILTLSPTNSTELPSEAPTTDPTLFTSSKPSSAPTRRPTRSPTTSPTIRPSVIPSTSPTVTPTSLPSTLPTATPSSLPSTAPTLLPFASLNPTINPTSFPSSSPLANIPTIIPTISLTGNPSTTPTANPTVDPTVHPSQSPSSTPSSTPTMTPTANPTASPTAGPSLIPSSVPSSPPTVTPTSNPTESPTSNPSAVPSSTPTSAPTATPTASPSASPSVTPTSSPTSDPTKSPTTRPSSSPSTNTPTSSPSFRPTVPPTGIPSILPTLWSSAGNDTFTVTFSSMKSSDTILPSYISYVQNETTNVHVTYNMSLAGKYRMSVKMNSTAILGSPFIISIVPGNAFAGNTLSRGIGLHQAAVGRSFSFELSLVDKFSNILTFGGSKFYIRLVGVDIVSESVTHTSLPTTVPTFSPTTVPSASPTYSPTDESPTSDPSSLPTGFPTGTPTVDPTTTSPTLTPSADPTSVPSINPTEKPSSQPTYQPTKLPTISPTSLPSTDQTVSPSLRPSVLPSVRPSSNPSNAPTGIPISTSPTSTPLLTQIPTHSPSAVPTSDPTNIPTMQPSELPSTIPTIIPSKLPTSRPSNLPSTSPSIKPSSTPTHIPTNQPTTKPTALPTVTPTATPTGLPTGIPTTLPSSIPSSIPTSLPTLLPTSTPTTTPSSTPTSLPSMLPTRFPIGLILPGDSVIPACQDLQNGKYLCSYTPANPGLHELRVFLLKSAGKGPGGGGLIGSYFTSWRQQDVDEDDTPLFIRLDSIMSFEWPTGDFLNDWSNSSTTYSTTFSVQSQQRCIVWDGYLVPPLNETFSVYVISNRYSSTVFIDGELVFDSLTSNAAKPIRFKADIAYHIYIEAKLTMKDKLINPTFLKLVWSTANIRETVIPSFFLYKEAEQIALSPFKVNVYG